MTIKHSHLLRATCVWTFFVWAVLVKNMLTADNHSLSFRLVHIALAIVSIGLAAAVWPLARVFEDKVFEGRQSDR